MKVLFIKLIVATLIVITEQTYCEMNCKGRKHIACNNPQAWASICPKFREVIRIDVSKRKFLRRLHNEKRNLVAGGKLPKFKGACRMATMKWDNELAYLAKLNVMQCEMKHDECRATKKFQYAGQNLGIVRYTGPYNFTKFVSTIIDGWFNEYKVCKKKYIASYPSSYQGPAIGHFTALVAERNTHLGCSAALYYESDKGPFNFLLACNYATTNMMNFPIYVACKKPAKNCTSTNPKYPYLCGPKEKYEVNVWMKDGVRYT